MIIKRHGDLMIVAISKNSVSLEGGEKVKETKSLVLAEGETTGHKHILDVPNLGDMDVYKLVDGSWLLSLKKDGVIIHEEHGNIVLPQMQDYIVYKKREKDWFSGAVRKIID